MVHEDVVTCEGCGATITHLICGSSPTHAQDPDYYLCDSCQDVDDEDPRDDPANNPDDGGVETIERD